MKFLDRLFGRNHEDPYDAFWKWFQANSDELRAVPFAPYSPDDIRWELDRQLSRIHKDLIFEFGPDIDGVHEFILSAEGIKDAFSSVQILVGSAPDLPGWKVTAFRPSAGWDLTFSLHGMRMSADDLWFESDVYDGKADVVIYIRKSLINEDYDTAGRLFFLILDHGLGEYIVATRIGYIDLQPLPDEPLPSEIKPISELSVIVNELSNQD